MPLICENGEYRQMTEQELNELKFNKEDALTQMIKAMSTATTVAQMRTAAKNFLTQTEVMASGN